MNGRFYAFIVILAASIAAIVLVGSNGGRFSDKDAPSPYTGTNLIVYVDPEGRINTLRPDGTSEPKPISPAEVFFTWPLWSPDGSQIAYSGIPLGMVKAKRPAALAAGPLANMNGQCRLVI